VSGVRFQHEPGDDEDLSEIVSIWSVRIPVESAPASNKKGINIPSPQIGKCPSLISRVLLS
jgi:hypothetical protein